MTYTPLQELQDKLSAAAETLTLDMDLTFKPMFGGILGYVKARVFASLSDIGLALKLSAADQAELLQVPEAKRLRYEADAPESKQYIVVPDKLQSSPETLAVWVKKSVDFVLAQPAPKPRAKPKKKDAPK